MKKLRKHLTSKQLREKSEHYKDWYKIYYSNPANRARRLERHRKWWKKNKKTYKRKPLTVKQRIERRKYQNEWAKNHFRKTENRDKRRKRVRYWYHKNKEKLKLRRNKWRKTNAAKRNRQCRAWRKRNPEKVKQLGKKYYEAKKEKHKASHRAWYYRNRQHCIDYNNSLEWYLKKEKLTKCQKERFIKMARQKLAGKLRRSEPLNALLWRKVALKLRTMRVY
jgi:hypothetical protein